MHVKICGLTNVDDALAATDAGADYLGFNFYPASPRCISPAECAHIVSAVATYHQSRFTRHALRLAFVGVFVNESPARVAAVLDYCGLDLAQLSGDEPPGHLMQLRRRAFRSIRGSRTDTAAFATFSPGAPALLLDAYKRGDYGGTGRTADWSAARAVADRFPIFLAGGLTPENVTGAIAQVNPWGVDVASGVESALGRKDHAKLRAFVQAAYGLSNSISPL